MQRVNNISTEPIPKPSKTPRKAPKAIPVLGKVGRARIADRRAKLKAEPANHEGYRICYLCSGWFVNVDLEHVKDASTHPGLRHDKTNHKWACRQCNDRKKNAR
jgi:hypothetical protein